ncbi:MAG: hypothetical protein ACFB02_04470 [Mastigocoleus sp.]
MTKEYRQKTYTLTPNHESPLLRRAMTEPAMTGIPRSVNQH